MESIRTIDPGQETFKAAESVAWPRRAPLFSQVTLLPDTPSGLIHDKTVLATCRLFQRNITVTLNTVRLKSHTHIKGNGVAEGIVKLEEGATGLKAGQLVATFTKTATKQNSVRNTFFFGRALTC